MEQVAQIISTQMRLMIVDGIKYTKIGDSEYYAQELFESTELIGYLSDHIVESGKSPYDYVICDSGNEEHFAQNLEKNDSIKLYMKLLAGLKFLLLRFI